MLRRVTGALRCRMLDNRMLVAEVEPVLHFETNDYGSANAPITSQYRHRVGASCAGTAVAGIGLLSIRRSCRVFAVGRGRVGRASSGHRDQARSNSTHGEEDGGEEGDENDE